MNIEIQGWGSDFERLADDMWTMMNELEQHCSFRSPVTETWRPRINLYETPTQFFVCVELAGVPRDQIDVRVEKNSLLVRGTRAKPKVPGRIESVGVHLMEIDSGRFHRQITFSVDINVDQIRAQYRDGYLWIVLPRIEMGKANQS